MLACSGLRQVGLLRPLLEQAVRQQHSAARTVVSQMLSLRSYAALQATQRSAAGRRRGQMQAAALGRRVAGSSRSYSGDTAMVTQTTSLLRNLHNGAEVFMVGTAHISRASADQVREVIRAVRPGTVMVELDAQRAARLRANAEPKPGDFLKAIVAQLGAPGFDLGAFFVRAGVTGFYSLLKQLGMDPGLEFKVAMEEAQASGARLVYGDQDVQRTLRALSDGLSLQQVMALMTSAPPPDLHGMGGGGLAGLETGVEAFKNRAAARAMVEHLRSACPKLAAALVDDRDQYMTDVLLRERGRVVAVVGLAHLDGIERRWEEAMRRESPLPRLTRGH